MTKTRDLKMKSIQKISLFILLALFSGKALASDRERIPEIKEVHQQRLTVKGVVKDNYGDPLPGATVVVKGTTNATITSADGNYSLTNVPPEATLVYSFMGLQSAEVAVKYQTSIDVVLQEDAKALDEVVVVAFGTQKKESMISSIQTITPKSLKVPSSNLTTALAGRMSGIIAYQRSGEPGKDNADFFIRGVTTFGYKVDPLILIDGVESTTSELARLQPDDISAFSILKDATATALYGARGANGVIQVSTKEGVEGPIKVSVRLENSFSGNTQDIKLADPITFMRMANEATLTRNPDKPLPYSPEKIDNTIAGKNPYVYPANDWRKLLVKDIANSQRVNMNLSGGGGIARYYIAASYTRDSGNLKVDKKNNFNNNINLQTYQIRSNINLELTKTTKAAIRLSGNFDDYRGPLGGFDEWGNRLSGGEAMYRKIMQANPVQFPAYYPASMQPDTKHILFGNASRSAGSKSADYINPYAELVRGYMDYSKSLLDAQVEVKQDLKFITKGLSFRGMFSTSRYSYFDINRKYNPYYYGVSSYDKRADEYNIMLLNGDGNPTEYLDYTEGPKDINSTTYFEGSLLYNRTFGKHDASGMLVFQRREQIIANKGTLQRSLPYRNQGLSGRFTYAYDSRFLGEFNFGYNGSERFHESRRYGFFPAVGLGWIVSNEKFWESILPVVSKFKLKATYGLVGNDAIGNEEDRFFYLSDMNMNDENKGYTFGENYGYFRPGVNINRYDNRYISWEKSYKANYGFEIGLFNELDIQFDYFTEKRKNILMERKSIPSSMGLSSAVRANVGEAKASGVDLSIDYNKMFKNGYWIQSRANFTYAHSEFVKYEEPSYNDKYRLHVGQSLKQEYGLIAERLFIDEEDVRNSPRQNFGEYGAGDIKYYDTNGDGQITYDDMVPLGYPTVPEIVYGFGFSAGNSHFDFSAFFQGSARSSFWIDGGKTSPFQNDVPLIKAYADSHWSEDNRDIYALWPRFSPELVNNNTGVRNSWFMRNGAFLRLKTVEIGYKLPDSLLKKLRIESLRLYATGNNLLLFSGFDLWDVEMGGNGLGYPIQRVVNLGVQINF